MKVYTIGRGEDCDIILDDDSGMVSRRHAILKSKGFNRYEIVDVSTNGTKVDAIRIKPNTPMKITRNSVVIFAGVKQLDWNKIPDDMKPVKIVAIALATLIVIAGVWIGFNKLFKSEQTIEPMPADTTKIEIPVTGGGSESKDAEVKEDDAQTGKKIEELLKAQEVKNADDKKDNATNGKQEKKSETEEPEVTAEETPTEKKSEKEKPKQRRLY